MFILISPLKMLSIKLHRLKIDSYLANFPLTVISKGIHITKFDIDGLIPKNRSINDRKKVMQLS